MTVARTRQPEHSATEYLPARRSLPALRTAAKDCHGCHLYEHATQTVFGEGAVHAPLVLVGEQPGNDEDLEGHPFVGPAGRLLDAALERAGIDRATDCYVTNAVKHFKWEPKGARRLHKKPNAREIGACLPWLEAEIDLLRPKVLVLLGATAVQAVLGPSVRVTEQRGKMLASRLSPHTLPTVHPSSLLRLPKDADRELEMSRFVADLAVAVKFLKTG